MHEWKRHPACLVFILIPHSSFIISTVTTTSPFSVNLIALPTRLISTWRSRVGSRDDGVGHVAADVAGQLQPLLVGAQGQRLQRVADAVAEANRRRVQVELAGLDLREVEDVVEQAAAARRPTTSPCPGSRAAPRLRSVSRASSVMPMMPFIGVRISWLMLARNSLLSRLAASAASLARFSSTVRFFSVMSRRVTTTPPTAGSPVRSLKEASTTRTPPSGRVRRTSADAAPPPAGRRAASKAAPKAARSSAWTSSAAGPAHPVVGRPAQQPLQRRAGVARARPRRPSARPRRRRSRSGIGNSARCGAGSPPPP